MAYPKAAQRSAASPNRMGRFETQWLRRPRTSRCSCRPVWPRSTRGSVLDMDLSVSPTHGEQQMSVSVRSCRSIALPFRAPGRNADSTPRWTGPGLAIGLDGWPFDPKLSSVSAG